MPWESWGAQRGRGVCVNGDSSRWLLTQLSYLLVDGARACTQLCFKKKKNSYAFLKSMYTYTLFPRKGFENGALHLKDRAFATCTLPRWSRSKNAALWGFPPPPALHVAARARGWWWWCFLEEVCKSKTGGASWRRVLLSKLSQAISFYRVLSPSPFSCRAFPARLS